MIWGPQHFGDGRMLNYITDGPNIDLRASAVGNRMTLFFSVDRPTSSGDGLIFIDAIALYPDDSAPPPIDAPTATPVEAPTEVPTVPPTEVSPTEVPTEIPTAAPTVAVVIEPGTVMTETLGPEGMSQEFLPITASQSIVAAEAVPVQVLDPPSPFPTDAPIAPATATALPSATPLPTATATPTTVPSATPTVTPTWTPWPTLPPPRFISAAGTAIQSGNVNSLRSVPSSRWSLALLGSFALAGVMVFGGSLFWVRRR